VAAHEALQSKNVCIHMAGDAWVAVAQHEWLRVEQRSCVCRQSGSASWWHRVWRSVAGMAVIQTSIWMLSDVSRFCYSHAELTP
jgi:hypothetical protein